MPMTTMPHLPLPPSVYHGAPSVMGEGPGVPANNPCKGPLQHKVLLLVLRYNQGPQGP